MYIATMKISHEYHVYFFVVSPRGLGCLALFDVSTRASCLSNSRVTLRLQQSSHKLLHEYFLHGGERSDTRTI